jgi:hypothetical protein
VNSKEGKYLFIAFYWLWIGFMVFLSYRNYLRAERFDPIFCAIAFAVFSILNNIWFYVFKSLHDKWLLTQNLGIEFRQWAGTDRTFVLDVSASRRLRQSLAEVELE